MRCQAQHCGLLGIVVTLLVGAAKEINKDPECTLDSCEQCFGSGKHAGDRRDLHFTGKDASKAIDAPLRIARCISYWDSQALLAHIVGILAEEFLGINVDYVHCEDESTCLDGLAGCLGWMNYECRQPTLNNVDQAVSEAVLQGAKLYNDSLADIMVLLEFTPEILNSSRNVIPTGPSGYVSYDGVFAYGEVLAAARANGLCDVEWFEALENKELRDLLHSPQQLIDDNIKPDPGEGCSASLPPSMVDRGWVCKNDWWLNAKCAKVGTQWPTECMVLLEDSMHYQKPEIYKFLGQANVPVAKIAVGWDPWRAFITGHKHNVTFTWWSPDATALHLNAVRLQMPQGYSSATIVLKAAWGTVLTADVDLRNLLSEIMLDTNEIESLMREVSNVLQTGLEIANDANASGRVYKKIACDWLRDHRHAWQSWLPGARNCYLGRFWDQPNQVCQLCPLGKKGVIIDLLSGELGCADCAKGKYADNKGSTVCTLCHHGRFSLQGSASCEACQVGKFGMPGNSSCSECPVGRTSSGTGSSSKEQCVCALDMYSIAGTCRACPDYMSCQPGSDFELFKQGDASAMRVRPGYMIRQSEPGQAYQCLPAAACPGGGIGECAHLRDGQAVACGKGVENTWKTYRSASGYLECASNNTDAIILAIFVLLGFLCLIAFSYQVSKAPQTQTRAGLQVVLMLSISVSSLQTMGVFGNLSITWFEPLRGLMNFMSWASLDLSYLKLGCTGVGSPVSIFIMRLMVAPATVPVILTTLLMKRRFGQTVDLFPELANAVGSMFTVFFTAIVISAITPFICYPHPTVRLDQTAEVHRYSMVSEPSFLCFEDPGHFLLLTASSCSLMGVAVPFLAFTAYGAGRHNSMLTSQRHRHARQLRAFRFLYQKFTPECHYWGLVINLRSLCICVVPVFPGLRNNTALQFCALAFTVSLFVILQLNLRPWRAHAANVVDGVLMICNLQLLVCAAIATDFAEKDSVGRFGAVLFILFCLVCIVAVLRSVYRILHKHRLYDHFICHHKGGAAAQARLLKVLLQEQSKCNVFIDSDNLQELDVLFDVVKTQVSQLVVYLTRDTLRRPWCAGEVCTAYQTTGVTVAIVKTTGFIPPTEMEMEELSQYIDCRGCNLKQYGIHFEDITKAYRWLLTDLEEIDVPRGFTTLRWKVVVDTLLHGVKPSKRSGYKMDMTPGLLLVSSEPGNDEACASAAIVARKINPRVMSLRELTSVHTTCDLPWGSSELVMRAVERASAVVVLLSAGSLASPQQVTTIIELMSRGTAKAIPVKIPGFEFPNDYFFDPEQLKPLCGDSWKPEEAATHLKAFFKIIAITLETSGSDAILQRQVDDIFSRVNTKSDWRNRAIRAEKTMSVKSEEKQVYTTSSKSSPPKGSVIGNTVSWRVSV